MSADALCRYPLFDALDRVWLADWLDTGQEVSADTGETLLGEGVLGDRVYLVREGRVRVFREGKGGREVSLGAFGPGDLFGEYALLPPGKNTATCRASAATTPPSSLSPRLSPVNGFTAHPGIHARLKAWLRLHVALSYLRNRAYLGFLTAPSILRLADLFEPIHFRAGETIQTEGLHADRFFLVRNGEISLTSDEDPTRVGSKVLGPGDCFGTAALLDEPRLPLVIAQSDTDCLALRRGAFESPRSGQRGQYSNPGWRFAQASAVSLDRAARGDRLWCRLPGDGRPLL